MGASEKDANRNVIYTFQKNLTSDLNKGENSWKEWLRDGT